jgi:hypothetical protein
MRTRDVAGKSALVATALALSLTGCAAMASPATILTPYPAADGVASDLPGTDVKLRDFLVVGTDKGSPAEVVGAVVNDGQTPIQVSLQTDLGPTSQPKQTLVRVAAQSITLIGPDQKTRMEIPELPVIPGAMTGMSAATTAGGRADFSVPVMLPVGPYASLTPGPSASASPTGTPTTGSAKTKKATKASATASTDSQSTDATTPSATATT